MKWLGPTWVTVDLDAVAKNIAQIQHLTTAEICAVLKGEAYGHGITITSLFLERYNPAYFAVNDIQEALEIRVCNITTPILILTPCLPEESEEIANNNLTATVNSFELIKALAKQGAKQKRKIKVHLKIDTGMHRIGVKPEDALKYVNYIYQQHYLELEGIYTHFAAANTNLRYTRKQLKILLNLKEILDNENSPHIIWHCANSSALINLPESHLDMVRVGTLLFGQSSTKIPSSIKLSQTWNLYSRIIQLQEVAKGETIGYNQTFITKKKSIIGVLPIGYGDGIGIGIQSSISQQLRNTLVMLSDNPNRIYLDNQAYPIIGKIAMGMCCIDLSNHPDPLSLYGAIVNIPTRRTTINRRLPTAYSLNNRLILINWQHKLWRSLPKNNRIYLRKVNPTIARQIINGGM